MIDPLPMADNLTLPPARLPLESPRLLLRDHVASDWNAVIRYSVLEDFWRFLPIEPQTPESARAYLAEVVAEQRVRPRLQYRLAAVDKASGSLVGGARLGIESLALKEADLGYAFDPKVWGQGYATEAVKQLLRLGFGRFRLHRVTALCDPENGASARVLEKAGMIREGHLREKLRIRGVWRDCLLFSMLDRDYRDRNP